MLLSEVLESYRPGATEDVLEETVLMYYELNDLDRQCVTYEACEPDDRETIEWTKSVLYLQFLHLLSMSLVNTVHKHIAVVTIDVDSGYPSTATCCMSLGVEAWIQMVVCFTYDTQMI